MSNSTKYVFVTGGVASSLGKGIISASLAKLLQARGYSATIQKLDPYLNIDPETLDPYEHGECYVTDDGARTDLDLGHYERFLNVPTSRANSITTGRIYQAVIDKERRGEYNGKTVQIIPHITDEIKERIQSLKGKYDIVITEIGGTVGDIESLPYVEAVRQMMWEFDNDCCSIHLTLIPYIAAAGELKSKPTQHSVKQLLELGVQPNILVCRTEHELDLGLRRKIAKFCNVSINAVIESRDVETIYDVPLKMQDEELDKVVLEKLGLSTKTTLDLTSWKDFLNRHKNPKHQVNIALVGKYVELQDAYKSISEAFIHSGAANECKVNLKWIQSENLTNENIAEQLTDISGILVAPGFGSRGTNGKIAAAKYARENNIPYFGISLGMQCAVIEFARNVLGIEDANSTEFVEDCKEPVITCKGIDDENDPDSGKRIGAYKCEIKNNSKTALAYNSNIISERHRNRYEFNNEYLDKFEENGMIAVGKNPDTGLVEVFEIKDHPWFVGVQYHPEFKSTVANPHPLFTAFVKASLENNKK